MPNSDQNVIILIVTHWLSITNLSTYLSTYYGCQYPRALNLIKTRSILLKLHTTTTTTSTTVKDFYLASRSIQIGSIRRLGLIKMASCDSLNVIY